MKKVALVALKQDRDELLLSLQRCGELMILPAKEKEETEAKETLLAQRTDAMLKAMRDYQEKQSMFAPRPEIPYADFLVQKQDAQTLCEEVAALSERLSSLKAERLSLQAQQKQLIPWLSLDIPVQELGVTQYTAVHTGFLASNASVATVAQDYSAVVQLLDTGAEGQAALLVCLLEEEAAFMDAVKNAGFTEAAPPRITGLPAHAYQACQTALENTAKEEASVKAQLTELAKRKEELELLGDQYRAQAERKSAGVDQTVSTIYLEGWARSDRVEQVKQAVEKVTEIYDLSFTDPTEEDVPPTVTKNNKFITQFETITDMFSRPGRYELDPNPVMGPWYWIIFGLMMGDAGYGLMMLVGIFAFKKLKKPRGDFAKLINVLYLSSFTTIFWGVMFGSYFGETWNPILFVPLDEPVTMLIFCMVIGVLHIFSGMIMKMATDIKAGRVWDAIFDQVSWMVLIVGLGLCFLPATLTVGMVMAAAGALTVLCTAGRAKKGLFSKITGGLLGLYNITSYMSDILSYSRILALSLATGVVGMVMNLLAGMVQGSVIGFAASLLIYLVGHIFNLAMGLLSAYVHDSRLQYIEFFNKFYDGGGKPFKPLQMDTKHVDVV